MYLESLALVNFKNLEEVDVRFSTGLNCFIGNNGAGKTNLMDAVYYLSFCKSFLNNTDSMNIRHDTDFFAIRGRYRRRDADENVFCGLKMGQKKHFKRNDKEYKKLSEHIGLLPLVMVSPSDINLIMGVSEERRKFADTLISQYDKVYLDNLIRYNRALMQRNNLLKQISSGSAVKDDQLNVWDELLVRYGLQVHEKREEYLNRLQPVFQSYYSFISSGKEKVSLVYRSQLHDSDFSTIIRENRQKDQLLQYTSAGIHKDDILFNLGEYQIKRTGSQGQKKTYLVALKLAEFDFIKQLAGLTPILVLDDVFDRLDKHRVEQIVKLVADDHFGQIFMTDTNREHLDSIIRNITSDTKIFIVDNGIVNEAPHEKE